MAFDAFALMLAMLALGMLFARLRVLPDNAGETLNLLVLYVCLPAAILLNVPKLRFDVSLLALAALPWLIAAASWALVTLASRWLKFRRDETVVLVLLTMLGNTSYVGFPMIEALLGGQALPYAVVYDQFGTFLLLSTVGLLVLARGSGDSAPSAKAIVRRILLFPPTWALAFGLTLMPEQPPQWIALALERLAGVLVMLVMLAVGLGIQLRLPRDEIAPLATGLVLKLVLLPAVSLPLAWLLGMRGEVLQVGVLETAMPPMITAAALAIAHGLAPRLAATVVGYGIVLSLVTLPLWRVVLQHVSL
ncbi:AEC family transporter [Luteimonas arsenica]|uniref:AEC family transporter n=1 Tax=Luteimonas arsenica TaxID=1586242 RepID=UPI0010567296|nr:AEC family transporter [Luteimonas arsenica]